MKLIILYEGGFGVFNSFFKIIEINENSNCIIIILYNSRRHNKFLSKFINNKNYWINIRLFDFFLGGYSIIFRKLFAKLIKNILGLFSKEVYLQDEYLNYYFKTDIFDSKDSNFWPDYLVHHKFLINNNYINTNTPKIKFPVYISNKNYYKKINLKIRNKNFGSQSIQRNSSALENYILALKNLVQMDCLVFISGELDLKYIENFDLFRHKNIKIIQNINKKLDIYSYLKSDCTIGPFSGSTNFNTIHYKPQLILDCYPIGHSWLNSTMAYKMVKTNKTELKQLLGRTSFPINENLNLRNCNKFEINEIILDYINNFKKDSVYGLTNKEIKINKTCHFTLTGSKISKKWYQLNNASIEF